MFVSINFIRPRHYIIRYRLLTVVLYTMFLTQGVTSQPSVTIDYGAAGLEYYAVMQESLPRATNNYYDNTINTNLKSILQ